MNRMWDTIIKPIVESINAQYIVEIGSEKGVNTKNILKYCMDNDAHMTTVDPFPKFDIDEFKAEYGDKFEIYNELSLSILPLLKDYDVILIDGDHNWYTVYNELKIIEKTFKGKKFPIAFLHDVSWPYGRRDLYYNPENIPEAYRQPYKKLGILPNHTSLRMEGGLNPGLNNAIYENNLQNGVLTALEDFINESELELSFEVVDIFHGLGIIFPKDDILENIVKNVIKNADLLNSLEEQRKKLTIAYSESNENNRLLKNQLNELEAKKTKLKTEFEESKKHNRSLQEKSKELETEKNNVLISLKELENNYKSLEEKLKEIETEKANLEADFSEIQNQNHLHKEKLVVLGKERNDIFKSLKEFENNNRSLKEKIRELETERDDVSASLKELETEKNNVLISLKELESSKESLEKKLKELEIGKNDIFVSLKESENNNKSLKEKIKELETDKNNISIFLKESENNNESLEKKIKESENEIFRLETALNEYEDHNQSLENKLAVLEDKSNKLTNIEKEKVELETKYSESDKYNKSLQSELKEEKIKLKYLENQLKLSFKSINEKNKVIIEVNEKREELKDKINELTIDFYEIEYHSNKNRSVLQRFFSRFPALYILFKTNKTGIKKALVNLKGYNAIKKNNLLDIGYYLKNNGDIRLSGADPILHYIYHGFKEGRSPNPTFDSEYYVKTYDDARNSNLNPLVHYCLYGIKDGRKIQKNDLDKNFKKNENIQYNQDYEKIVNSGLFDINWYLEQYPDIDPTIDPIDHYLNIGYKDGYNPGPLFDTRSYLENNPDVVRDGINPLIHYIKYGMDEGRITIPIIHTEKTMKMDFSTDDSDNNKIRTLFFTHDLKMQGAQNSLYEIVIGLKKKGLINPIVYSPNNGPLRKAYEKNGIEVIIGNNKLQNPTSLEEFNKNLTYLIRDLEEFNIQFIHSNTLRTFYGIEIARRMKIPCIWNPRESEPWETYFDYLPENIKEIALNCFNYPKKVVFVSKYTKNNWKHLDNGNFTLIHNALNTERLIYNTSNWTREEARASLGIREDEVTIILVGTISERKGQKDIIHAIRYLPSDITDRVKIFLIGDKPSKYSDELHELHSKLQSKLKDSVSIIPETTNENEFYKVVNYYLAADILLFSSRIESYPRVILEALYFNLPIITTPVFGVKEQVKNGFSALFYEPGDIKQLNVQLIKIVKDEDLRYELRENTKKQMEKLSTHAEMLEKYGSIILDCY